MGGPEDDLQTLPPLGRGAPLSRLRGDVRTEARSRGPGGSRVPMTAKRKRTSPNGGVRRPPGPLLAVAMVNKRRETSNDLDVSSKVVELPSRGRRGAVRLPLNGVEMPLRSR